MTDQVNLEALIGVVTTTSTVVVERGPVAFFASSVFDESEVYTSEAAAKAEGFDAIPAPPTFPFVMENWGRFSDLQESDEPQNPGIMVALAPLLAQGGLILHGEQSFSYHRAVQVGDVLKGHGTIVDAYQKESKGKTMTFVVTETLWSDAETGDPVVSARFNVIHRS
jgi:hypothetical protein